MNISDTIIPKSDQLNADDLLTGPLTIKITAVKAGSAEQPVVIHYEGDNGHPYKPGKSMRRVLIVLWGAEAKAYLGHRLTLYADPTVRFGGSAVGGIRISHASGISKPVEIMLTKTRGKKEPFVVQPLAEEKQTQASTSSSPVDQPDRALTEDIGNTKAREGSAALRAWWETVPKGPVKTAVGAELLPTWKQIAERADASAEGRAA